MYKKVHILKKNKIFKKILKNINNLRYVLFSSLNPLIYIIVKITIVNQYFTTNYI